MNPNKHKGEHQTLCWEAGEASQTACSSAPRKTQRILNGLQEKTLFFFVLFLDSLVNDLGFSMLLNLLKRQYLDLILFKVFSKAVGKAFNFVTLV